jgi:hypothetical protein
MTGQRASSNSRTIPQLLSSWLFWRKHHQGMRQRHGSGLRLYLAVFQVRLFNPYPFENILSFSHYLIDFSQTELRKLSKTPFVPVTSTEDNSTKRLQPNQCYSGTGGSELHSKLFAFVNFGARANVFLGACGTKQEPSVEDIAQILVAEPQRIYKLANGREK